MAADITIFRAEVLAALQTSAPNASLRYARGDSLFISNAPGLNAPGYISSVNGALLHITPSAERIAAFEASLDARLLPDFAAFHGAQVGANTIELFCVGVKLCALHGSAGEIALYARRVRQSAALALRTGEDGGGLYACAWLLEGMK